MAIILKEINTSLFEILKRKRKTSWLHVNSPDDFISVTSRQRGSNSQFSYPENAT